MINLASDRQWLWSNNRIPFSRGQYNVDFGKALDSSGWDEILLSISPARFKVGADTILNIPDHGDLVGQVWDVTKAEVDSNGDAICELTANGRAANYRITRTVRLRNGRSRIEINYALLNREAVELPWFWSAHALLATESDLHIDLPENSEFRIDQFLGDGYEVKNGPYLWPHLNLACGGTLDLSQCFLSQSGKNQFAAKVFVRSPEAGSVSVRIGQDNERLVFHYDSSDLPWLGLWINNRGWSGDGGEPYQNLGIEPATTPFDDIVEAAENDAITWLQPVKPNSGPLKWN